MTSFSINPESGCSSDSEHKNLKLKTDYAQGLPVGKDACRTAELTVSGCFAFHISPPSRSEDNNNRAESRIAVSKIILPYKEFNMPTKFQTAFWKLGKVL